MTENQQLFMEWMQENFPVTYEEALIEATDKMQQKGLSGLGASDKSWWSSFTESIGDLGGKYIQYKSQKKIMKLQLRRAEQGKPPLDTSQLAPVIKIQPELPPALVNDIKKYVIPGAIGLAVLVVGIMLAKK